MDDLDVQPADDAAVRHATAEPSGSPDRTVGPVPRKTDRVVIARKPEGEP